MQRVRVPAGEFLMGDDAKPQQLARHEVTVAQYGRCVQGRAAAPSKAGFAQAGDDPQGSVDSGLKLRRGGSWQTWALYARRAYRNWNAPDTRCPRVGIRLVMEAPL
jgi:formylglycine-generating enzyme required for sulfatase activity